MFSKIKKTVFTTQFYVFVLLGGSVMINACQEQDSAQPQLEEVQYEMYDDQFVTVVLDPNKEHKFHSFASLEEHDNYLLTMEESEEKVVVNKKMYEDLSHYFDPYMLSVMDMNYEIEVAGERFKADREAIYKKTVQSADWELYVFYGLSGRLDLEETALIYQYKNNLNELDTYEFRSPTSIDLIDRIDSENSAGRIAKADYYFYWVDDSTQNNYKIKYRKSPNGTTLQADMRWRTWHEEYRNWGKKAKGGTVTEIYRYEVGHYKWEVMNFGEKIGDFHSDGDADHSVPYIYVKVKTSKGQKQDIEDDGGWTAFVNGVARKAGKSAESWHTAKVRLNDENSNTTIMNNLHHGY